MSLLSPPPPPVVSIFPRVELRLANVGERQPAERSLVPLQCVELVKVEHAIAILLLISSKHSSLGSLVMYNPALHTCAKRWMRLRSEIANIADA